MARKKINKIIDKSVNKYDPNPKPAPLSVTVDIKRTKENFIEKTQAKIVESASKLADKAMKVKAEILDGTLQDYNSNGDPIQVNAKLRNIVANDVISLVLPTNDAKAITMVNQNIINNWGDYSPEEKKRILLDRLENMRRQTADDVIDVTPEVVD
jgi:hypothetical protein